MMVDLFGSLEITTDAIRAMQPHVRSECFALMREAGYSDHHLSLLLGVRSEVIRRVMDARHAYRIPRPVIADGDDEADEDEQKPSTLKKAAGLPRSAFIILKFMADQGGQVAASKATLARELDVPLKAVDYGMARLVDDEFVIRVKPGFGGKPPLYRLTDKALQLAAMALSSAAGT